MVPRVQYPLATGQGYPLDTLTRLCDAVPGIRAIEEALNDRIVPLAEIF